jgi:rare lipoprotein A
VWGPVNEMKIHSEICRSRRRLFSTAGLILVNFLVLNHSASPAVEKKGPDQSQKTQIGLATYYCRSFHGEKTAFGKTYNRHHLIAAHPTFPNGTLVRVTHLSNGRQVAVPIVDRGPSLRRCKQGIIIDLSRAAAEKLGMIRKGRARVRLEVLEWGKLKKIERGRDHDQPTAES